MRVYLQNSSSKTWAIVETGYTPPTVDTTVDGKIVKELKDTFVFAAIETERNDATGQKEKNLTLKSTQVENFVDDNSDDDLAFLSRQFSQILQRQQRRRNSNIANPQNFDKTSKFRGPHVMSLSDSDISDNEANDVHDEQVQEAEKDDERLKKMVKETIEVKQFDHNEDDVALGYILHGIAYSMPSST
ncbi:uncharacterized protein LOC132295945 [Cornus florida]|uniref:uncharacterized protein LOC132295945 n=1 Tax=Cornus florida TaxID=4283 RepID=UPI00289E84CF|nr:uncharacterized protein LOC132295945 [Cornus florida]